MCCFSRPVELVSNTNVFARSTPRGTQILVYSMTVAASEELAMVLPVPTAPGAPEDAVRFINLEGYPRDPTALFFPTVHIHDGTVHATARFDHALYCQMPEHVASRLTDWARSERSAGVLMEVHKAEQTLQPEDVLYRRLLVGEAPNRDQWVFSN